MGRCGSIDTVIDTASESQPSNHPQPAQQWRESLRPAWWWWLVCVPLWFTVYVAVWAYLGGWWALGITVAIALFTGSWIVQLGLHTAADSSGFRAGRNRIDWRWVSHASPMDAAQTQAHLHSPGNHRDFLLTRSYVGPSVVLWLDDPADPHPAWVVSTRRPEQLARVVNAHVRTHRASAGVSSVARDARGVE